MAAEPQRTLLRLEGALQNGIAEPTALWHVCGAAESLTTMAEEFYIHPLLSHSAKDKAVVRPLAERLVEAGLRLWFDRWVLKPAVPLAHRMGERSGVRAAKIEEGLEHSKFGFRTSVFGLAKPSMSAKAFGSAWAQLCLPCTQPSTFNDQHTGSPLNKKRRFLPLRLDDACTAQTDLHQRPRPISHE